jgi:ribonuclease E
MSKKMLIDATHAEETRVAVVDSNRLVEFDYESCVRKQLKGGIYLAKVTRVEPSLQAAFVNFGGNRHGFLPFSEIHPDYFRIPVSDREALLAAQEEELKKLDEIEDDEDEHEDAESSDDEEEITADSEEEDADDEEAVVEVGGADKPADEEDSDLKKKSKKKSAKAKKAAEDIEDDIPAEEVIGNIVEDEQEKTDEELDAEALAKAQSLETPEDSDDQKGRRHNNRGRGRHNNRGRHNGRGRGGKRSAMRGKKSDEIVDDNNGKPFRFNLRHKYKIQEVVKRGQIMLIQVSKEERGNKGAAVTTYMSLPGRYCVLMPNSPRGGGVSRKIGNFKDRKRMRAILKELTIPTGMSVILRTAGVSRTKADIKRDLDYLTRLWNNIREDTLKSTAPALINEEGNLIKRSIRDLYSRDMDEVLISGNVGYKTAKSFMKMLVPSHAKKVKEYDDERVPLFHRYNVENQISDIGKIEVMLKSGGSLVINPTEALVSIDVNSGKATKERHIEETALKTNLEAAAEVARQLRLRDLGGLVVIDFIDMEERRNNRKVENKLRDALSSDRARIQVGRISSFGLLELSRQRLNPSLTEAQFEKCPHCEGSGVVKTLDYAAISAMRALEEEGIKGTVAELSLNVPNAVAVYILNNKRDLLANIEKRYGFRVHIRVDEELKSSEYRIETITTRKAPKKTQKNKTSKKSQADDIEEINDEEGDDKSKRNRRRGKRGGHRRNQKETESQNDENQIDDIQAESNDSDQEVKKKPAVKGAKKATKKSAKKSSKSNDDKKLQQN